MTYAAFIAALNEKPKSSQGRPPPDPRPIGCSHDRKLPRFRDGVPVACDCGAPAHPLAYLMLMPPGTVLTGDQRRRCREIVDAELQSSR
jgi:hypothetical protein